MLRSSGERKRGQLPQEAGCAEGSQHDRRGPKIAVTAESAIGPRESRCSTAGRSSSERTGGYIHSSSTFNYPCGVDTAATHRVVGCASR